MKALWFLFVSHWSHFLSHPSVPGPRNLVNKQAPERCREPATSWKPEATRLSTNTLSFQEGITGSEQRPWLSVSSPSTCPTLFLSASSLPSSHSPCRGGLGPPLLSCSSPSCPWPEPQDLVHPQSCAESSFLPSFEENACQEAQLFGECEIQYFNGAVFHGPLEKEWRVCCWSVCN